MSIKTGPACKKCQCSKCSTIKKCFIIPPRTWIFCREECKGTMGVGNCKYANKENAEEEVKMSNQPEIITTELAIRVFETTPAVVSFNYQEISDHLDGVLEKYKGLVFSDNDVAECKKTIAELRKGQKSLDEFRKATKKQLTESVTAFEAQCKLLYGKFEGVITPLTLQQEQFELDRRVKKRAEIQIIIDSLVEEHSLNEKYSSQLFGVEEYFNKGKTIKSIKTELSVLANTLRIQQDKEVQDIDLIKMKVQLVNVQYQLTTALRPETYVRFLAFNSMADVEAMITLDAQEISDSEKRVAEACAAKAAEIPKVIEAISSPGPAQIPSVGNPVSEDVPVERSTITAIYEVTGTDEQLSELEAYLAVFTLQNDFSWRINEKSLDEDEDIGEDDFMN